VVEGVKADREGGGGEAAVGEGAASAARSPTVTGSPAARIWATSAFTFARSA